MRYLILLALALCSCSQSQQANFKIKKIIDGDSLVIESLLDAHEEEVRLLGIDAPEYSQDPWGKRAREFLLSKIPVGENIFIETTQPSRDKYGRLLAFINHNENGKNLLLNEEILANGFAELFVLQRWNPYNERLKTAEANARESGLNIWSSNGLTMRPYEYRKKMKSPMHKT